MTSRPIKIVAIEPSGRLFGSEYCLLDILRGTSSDRFLWTVLTTQGPFAKLLAQEEQQHKVLPILPENLHLKSKWHKLCSYARLFASLAKIKPDVLYVNQAGILRISHLIARAIGTDVTCQVQTLEDAASLSRTLGEHTRVRSFVCNSRFIAEQTLVDSSRKCVLYQGVTTKNHSRKNDPPTHSSWNKIRLGILGRISPTKGHYLLAEVAQKLATRGREFSIRVIGEGLTPKDTTSWLDYIRVSGMQSFFDFRGYRSDLYEELSEVDLLLIPSLAEPLGRVLFDAANIGVPVIVSDAGGLGEIASLYQIGLPFRSGDPESLADAILKFFDNYENESRRFHKNSKAMLDSLSMESYIKCIEQILQSTSLGEACNIAWFGDRIPSAS